jgi:signal transduction histidine kinase
MPGTWLGLAIVKELVNMFMGRIWMKKDWDAGIRK